MGIDRMSFGLKQYSKYAYLKKWKLADILFCILLIGLNIGCYFAKPFERQFTINDITISHPFAVHERVNNTELVVYSFVIPLGVISLLSLVFGKQNHRYYLLYISVLGLFVAFLSDMLITNYVKNWIGRCRPDFLARCVPRDGLQRDVLYTAADACTTTDRDRLLDGFRTTPSGHSSESFAGLGYTFLWLSGQLLTEHPDAGTWRKGVAFIPLMCATFIALSRTQDYRHHFIDVTIGSILGFCLAWWAYRRYFPPIASALPFRPLMDDSPVALDEGFTPPRSVDEEMAPLNTASSCQT